MRIYESACIYIYIYIYIYIRIYEDKIIIFLPEVNSCMNRAGRKGPRNFF